MNMHIMPCSLLIHLSSGCRSCSMVVLVAGLPLDARRCNIRGRVVDVLPLTQQRAQNLDDTLLALVAMLFDQQATLLARGIVDLVVLAEGLQAGWRELEGRPSRHSLRDSACPPAARTRL